MNVKILLLAALVAVVISGGVVGASELSLSSEAGKGKDAVLRDLCGYISGFIGQYRSIHNLRVKDLNELDVQAEANKAANDIKLKGKNEEIYKLYKTMTDVEVELDNTKSKTATTQKQIDAKWLTVKSQEKAINDDAIRIQRDSVEQERREKEQRVIFKRLTKESEQYDDGFFAELKKVGDECRKNKDEKEAQEKLYKKLLGQTVKLTKTIANQVGDVQVRKEEVITKIEGNRQWDDNANGGDGGFVTVGGKVEKKIETVVEGQLAMVVTQMNMETNALRELLLGEANMFPADVVDKAQKRQDRVMKATEEQLAYDKKQASQAFDKGKNLRFRGSATHLKTSSELTSSMSAISQHVKSYASKMGQARHSLSSLLDCGVGECGVDNLISPEAFKKRLDDATSTYKSFYSNLCSLEKTFSEKNKKFASSSMEFLKESEKKDKTIKAYMASVTKFKLLIKKAQDEYETAEKNLKKLDATLVNYEKGLKRQQEDARKEFKKNEIVINQLIAEISKLQMNMQGWVDMETKMKSENEACFAKHKKALASIEKLKAEALADYSVVTETKARTKVYKEKANAEDDAFQNAAEKLNKMRDELMTTSKDLKIADLTGKDFIPY